MADSFNCLRLDNKDVFQVGVYKEKENDKQNYFKLGDDKIPFEKFKVGQLAKIILLQEEFKVSKLWKVDVDESKLNPDSTDEDIKKLGGVSMGFEYDFMYYFPNDYEPTRNKIHIVAVVATTATGKCLPMFYLSNKKFAVAKYRFGLISLFRIKAQNLPEKLEYRDPQPLLKGSGSLWDFQASDALEKELKDAIHDHFKFWKAGQLDKTKIPQYFVLAGAGEGKSRTAQELPRLLTNCTNDDIDLQNRLKDAFVFNLSFENGTKLLLTEEADSSHAIGNRMLFQLLKLPDETWDDFKNRYRVTPSEVLRRVAKYYDREYKKLNVIIILDGIQVVMNNRRDGNDKRSFFYNCINQLGILSLSGPFVFTCCTATISMPIHRFLASSQLRRVFLPVTSLKPPRIMNNPVFANDPVVRMLIDDMGGHGRALEALADSVEGKDLKNVNFVDLINDVRTELIKNYQGWLSNTTYLKPVLRIILSHTRVDKNQNISTSDGSVITVDDVTQFGLVRFVSQSTDQVVGYLTCPYIWLWIMAHALPKDKLLQCWDFNYYNEVRNKSGDSNIPPGCQYWQNFEYFVAQFRSLKSNIYNDDEQVELRIIHNGARHNFGNSSIYNRNLKLSTSVHKVSTKSEVYRNKSEILCQKGTVDIKEAEHIIINAPSAESGDSFCTIKMVESPSAGIPPNDNNELLKTETHQCKLVKQPISQRDFDDEYKKATSPGDTFILYTSASAKNLELHQPMSAIVSDDNWEEYFGSFAGRCYNYAMGPPDINEATYTQLTGMNFIGETRATNIMEERRKGNFSGIDDCENRTKIPRTYLEPFF